MCEAQTTTRAKVELPKLRVEYATLQMCDPNIGWVPVDTREAIEEIARRCNEHDALIQRAEKAEAELARLEKGQELLADCLSDNIVVMQAAWIEWQRGRGIEAAMRWIQNSLIGPGLIPGDDEPWANNAQHWASANKNERDRFPFCHCGTPSVMQWMRHGFCCQAHMDEKKPEIEAELAAVRSQQEAPQS